MDNVNLPKGSVPKVLGASEGPLQSEKILPGEIPKLHVPKDGPNLGNEIENIHIGESEEDRLSRSFELHEMMNGVNPGERVSGVEAVGAGHRVRYRKGSIYRSPTGKTGWVYGEIEARYNALGGPTGRLGFPVSDEEPMSEGGRASAFEGGTIYWWPDEGAIDINDIVVTYTGLVAFEITDGPGSDEPYVTLGVVSPTGGFETQSQVYQDVDKGQSRSDSIELYRGKPHGITLSAVLMENDSGTQEQIRANMKKAVAKGVEVNALVASASVGKVPVFGPGLAMASAASLPLLASAVADVISVFAHDDFLGEASFSLTAKDMVVLAARTEQLNERGVAFRLLSGLMSRKGAHYRLYFDFAGV